MLKVLCWKCCVESVVLKVSCWKCCVESVVLKVLCWKCRVGKGVARRSRGVEAFG